MDLKTRCNRVLMALLGNNEALVAQWWRSKNLAFDGMTPEEMMKQDAKRVASYLNSQLSGDYL